MKWFFEDEPKKEPLKQNRPFFEQLTLDFFKACFVLVRVIIERFLDWVAKPLLSIFFSLIDPRGKSKSGRTLLGFCAGILLLFIYSIPTVRNLTLSKSHTLNLGSDAFAIPFPDSKHFEITKETEVIYIGGQVYLTYGKDVEDMYLPAIKGACRLVPRGKTLRVSSDTLPPHVVGFKNAVTYKVKMNAGELSSWQKLLWFIEHPPKLLASKEELEGITVVYGQDATWNELQEGWFQVWSYSNGKKPFEMTARWNENSMMCF